MDSATAAQTTDQRALVSLFSQLRKPSGQANPIPIYKQFIAMGEIFPHPWGGKLVTSYSLSDRILRDKEQWKVLDRAWRIRQGDRNRWSSPASLQMTETLPLLNSPSHTRIRGALGNPFSRRSLLALGPSVERSVERLLDGFTEQLREGPADFVELVTEELPVITIGEWMSLPQADYKLLRDLTHDQVHTQEFFPRPTDIATSDRATAQLEAYFTDFIKERRKKPGADPVSSWIRTWDKREADPDRANAAVHSLALFMVLAALETTGHLLANVTRLLLEHPGQLDHLRRQPDLIPDAVEETLRFDAPIHLISRMASSDTELDGVSIAAGETVQLLIGAAHHDPAAYADPSSFDVRRRHSTALEPSAHLGFGAGVHFCLGNALARLEAVSLLTGLLRRPHHLGINACPQWASRIAFRRMESLSLRLLAKGR